MNNYFVRKVLDEDQLRLVRINFRNLEWFDGNETTNSSLKVSLSAVPEGDAYHFIDNLLIDEYFKNSRLKHMTQPKSSTLHTISKMEVGGKYGLHSDHWTNGHFSTTTFLSDPSSYDGGELLLYIDGETKSFKLDAGHAITYMTGIPHSVTPVTRGERHVAVNWITSEISDPALREIVGDVQHCKEIIWEDYPLEDNFANDVNSPRHILAELEHKIRRAYSKF